MYEVWGHRKELDAYEAIVVGIATRIDGTAYYEYHKSFSARASALIQQQNVKVDWGLRDNGLFCSLFVGQRANVCSMCGSVAHLSGFCPTLVTPKTHNANTSHHFTGRGNFSSKGGPAAPTTGLALARQRYATTIILIVAALGIIADFCIPAWHVEDPTPMLPAQL